MELQAIRGTRDFFPDECRFREWLFGLFRQVASRFGFEEIDAPIVESADLFIRKGGEEILGQLYHFELHGRHLALRPEMTPSMARMVMAKGRSAKMPLRWCAIGQNWRYERMVKGRRREHYQLNMDIWGEEAVDAEAELISAVFAVIEAVGLPRTAVEVRVNSRDLLETFVGEQIPALSPEAFVPLCVAVDKIAKIGADKVVEMLVDPEGEVGIDERDARAVVDFIALSSLDEVARLVPGAAPAVDRLRGLFRLLEAYGVGEQVRFDAGVVRGLAYYTGIVFEAFDAAGGGRSICGGGRYDRLTRALGGQEIPAVGFGLGDVVLGDMLAASDLMPVLGRRVDDLVFAFDEEGREAAARVCARLRSSGRSVLRMVHGKRLKRVLAEATQLGAERIFLIGPDELARGVVKVRDLDRRSEVEEPL